MLGAKLGPMRLVATCALALAALMGTGTLLSPAASAQAVSVDGGYISIWQDLTNYTNETARIPRTYRFPVCRILPSSELLEGLREFGYAACPTPLAEPSARGSASLILRDLATNDLTSNGGLVLRFVVERQDGTEQELAEFSGQRGRASGLMPWASMALERGDLIVAHLRVQGSAVRRLEREGVILLVSLGV